MFTPVSMFGLYSNSTEQSNFLMKKKKKIHKYIDHYKRTLSRATAFAAISDEEKQKCSQNPVCWNNGQEHRH